MYNRYKNNGYDQRIVTLIRMHRCAKGLFKEKRPLSRDELLHDLDWVLDMVGQSQEFTAESCAKVFEILDYKQFTWDKIKFSTKRKLIAALECYSDRFNALDLLAILGALDRMKAAWHHLTVGIVNRLNDRLSECLRRKGFTKDQILKTLESVINIEITDPLTMQVYIDGIAGAFKYVNKYDALRIYSCFDRYCKGDTKLWKSLEQDCQKVRLPLHNFILDANLHLEEHRLLSTFHRDVKKILTSMCPSEEPQYNKIIGSCIADIYIPRHKIIIILNELQHYDSAGRLDTHQQRRKAFLERIGYEVISINYGAWRSIDTDEEKRRVFSGLLPKNLFFKTITNDVDSTLLTRSFSNLDSNDRSVLSLRQRSGYSPSSAP